MDIELTWRSALAQCWEEGLVGLKSTLHKPVYAGQRYTKVGEIVRVHIAITSTKNVSTDPGRQSLVSNEEDRQPCTQLLTQLDFGIEEDFRRAYCLCEYTSADEVGTRPVK